MSEVTITIPIPGVDVPAPLPDASNPQSARQSSQELVANRLSIAQADELIAQFKELGISRDRIAAAARASGVAYEPDPRTPAEKTFDAIVGPPPAHDAYRLDLRSTDMPEAELDAVASGAREWMGLNMFPGNDDRHGPALIEEAMDTFRATGGMKPDELARWKTEQNTTLERIAKQQGTTATDMRNTVQLMLDVPGDFAKTLRDRPLSASFVVNAWFQARRIAARAQAG